MKTASLPWLVADIGGSNARFACIFNADFTLEYMQTFAVADFPNLTDALEAYLNQLSALLGNHYLPPRHASFAVATTTHQELIEFTNSSWNFTREHLIQKFKLHSLQILNDFEALALSLPRLQTSQMRCHAGTPLTHGTLAVIGPGTGLGVASVIETPHGWLAIPGEGGHATLCATDEFESAVLSWVRKTHQHVSAERLLSGIGLPNLHAAVAEVSGFAYTPLKAHEIIAAGLQDHDPACRKSLTTFCELLGSFAGNLALTVGARSGVYIGGGIVPRLGEAFFNSQFRTRFEAKGRFQEYLKEIPTALITDTMAALTGAALSIEQQVN